MDKQRRWHRLPRVGRADVPAEVRSEVETHLELQIADLIAEGWSGEGASGRTVRRRHR